MARNTPVNDDGEHDCDYIGTPCRHLTCGRCNKVTDNTTQGHYSGWCTATNSLREMHFCCPDDCELTTVKTANEQRIDSERMDQWKANTPNYWDEAMKKGGTK